MKPPGDATAPPRTIVLLHYTAPPVVGGVERVLGEHAVLLADAGHRVRIVAGRGASPDPRIDFVGVPLADTHHPVVLGLQRDLDAGRRPASFEPTVATLTRDLAAALGDADVVIAHNVGSLNRNLALTSALHQLAAAARVRRLILWHHDVAWALPAYRPALHPGHPWDLLRTAWPGTLQVAVSEMRRMDLAALHGAPAATIRVVPDGVDVPGLLGLAETTSRLVRRVDLMALDPLVLLPVRITPRKNIEMALRVVAAMRTHGRPSAGLLVTGPVDPHAAPSDPHFRSLLELRAALGLDRAAIFLAEHEDLAVEPVLLRDLYRLADLLFLPSFDEGFGLPILEAATHRLPIVCSDLPVLRDLAGDAAVYVDPGADPEHVAALALARLDGDALASFARRVRREYSWDAIYRQGIEPLLGA